MIPVLYPPNAADFSSFGLGVLTDTISCEVTEERNGVFECLLKYPDNGSYTPDWKTKNLVLTPSLYVIGTTADQITTANVTSVKWYVGDSNTAFPSLIR